MDARILRQAYDRAAPGYEERFREQQSPKIDAVLAMLPHPGPGARLVDVGAGTGLFAEALSTRPEWAGVPVVAIDLSRGMLTAAAVRDTWPVQADARRLPLAAASCSQVVSVTGLVAPEDVLAALPELCRVVAPGGSIVLSLRIDHVPDGLDSLVSALPLERGPSRDVAGDRVFAWVRT